MTTSTSTANDDLIATWGVCREMSNDFRFTAEDVDAVLLRGATQYARLYAGSFDFMREMHAKALRSWLTMGQAKGVLNCMMAEVRRERAAAEPRETVDFTGLRALFTRAGANLRAPRITLMLDDNAITVKLMTRGAHLGSINISSGTFEYGTWYGRVEMNGELMASRHMNPAVRQLIQELSENPVAAAQRYAHLTGNCCFCNRQLDDERSTSAGYGPVCAGHYGLPWGDREAAPVEVDASRSDPMGGITGMPSTRPVTTQVQALPGMTPLGFQEPSFHVNPETDYRMASDLEVINDVVCQACGRVVPAFQADWQEVPGNSEREGNVCRRCSGG